MAENQRDRRGRGGPHHHLVIEAPEILQAAAAARDDDQVRSGDGSAFGECVEALDGAGDLLAGGFALHPHRPDEEMHRKAVGNAVVDVADDGAGRRGDDADDAGHEGQRPLALGGEQAFGFELAAAFVEQRHQRAGAGRLDLLDHDLVFRRARIGGQLAGGDDLQPFLGLEG